MWDQGCTIETWEQVEMFSSDINLSANRWKCNAHIFEKKKKENTIHFKEEKKSTSKTIKVQYSFWSYHGTNLEIHSLTHWIGIGLE
jgi:hypothetical protein